MAHIELPTVDELKRFSLIRRFLEQDFTAEYVYSLAVLEYVRDVDATLASIETVLRPGGRFAFVVPMHELRAKGPIPDYTPIHGYADHCRVFTEAELHERFGRRPEFRLVKLPGEWKHGELPDCFEAVEFGAFFVSYAKEG